MIEKELKYKFRKDDFFKIKKFFNENFEFINEEFNENYYFDNESLIFYKNDITIRIRTIDKSLNEFTIKVPIQLEQNKYIKEEYTVKIDDEKKEHILNRELTLEELILYLKIKIECISNYKSTKLKCVGCLKTKRSFYMINEEKEYINLDESEYLKIKDYELEWETPKLVQAQAILENIFEKINITPINYTESKYKRFIKAVISGEK